MSATYLYLDYNVTNVACIINLTSDILLFFSFISFLIQFNSMLFNEFMIYNNNSIIQSFLMNLLSIIILIIIANIIIFNFIINLTTFLFNPF